MKEAKRSEIVTHYHREGIKRAQAVATSIFLAKNGESKENIKLSIEKYVNIIQVENWMKLDQFISFIYHVMDQFLWQ